MSVSPVSFKGIYKVTMPKVTDAKNPNEKAAYSELVINTAVMGHNASVMQPKKASDSVYFKIDDRCDAKFEAGFRNILDACNKKFNVDLSKIAYIQKVSAEEYNKAQAF